MYNPNAVRFIPYGVFRLYNFLGVLFLQSLDFLGGEACAFPMRVLVSVGDSLGIY